MRTVSWGIGIILSSWFFSFSASALERDGANLQSAGEIVSVQGKVYVRQESSDKAQQQLRLHPAQNIYVGDIINTSSDGAVKILLKDKTIVDVGPSSLFKVDQFALKEGGNREVDLDMKFGRLRVSVAKKITGTGKFNVKTRAATMGVRGTEFIVNSALGDAKHDGIAPKTDVTVLQGRVDVKSPAGTNKLPQISSLTAGAKISTQMGMPSTVVQLNDKQLINVASVSRVADNTFTKAITIEMKPEGKSESKPERKSEGKPSPRTPASETGSTAAGTSIVTTTEPKSGSLPATGTAVGSLAGAMADIAAAVPIAPVSFSQIGIPGAPSVVNVTTAPVTVVNSSYRVTVIVGP